MVNKKRPIRRKASKGKIRNVIPTIIDGIYFKSKLEAYCYTKLKENNIEFGYETLKVELITPFDFKNDSWELCKSKGKNVYKPRGKAIRGITYTPDFIGSYKGQPFIIETKGFIGDSFPLRWKLFKKYINERNLGYNLYMPRNRKQIDETINLIKSKNESI